MLRQYKLKDYKFRLVLWVLILSVIGIMVIGSQERQSLHLTRVTVMDLCRIIRR